MKPVCRHSFALRSRSRSRWCRTCSTRTATAAAATRTSSSLLLSPRSCLCVCLGSSSCTSLSLFPSPFLLLELVLVLLLLCSHRLTRSYKFVLRFFQLSFTLRILSVRRRRRRGRRALVHVQKATLIHHGALVHHSALIHSRSPKRVLTRTSIALLHLKLELSELALELSVLLFFCLKPLAHHLKSNLVG